MRNERAAPGALDACRVVGCAKLSLHKRSPGRKKVDAQMPRGALSVARQLPPLETVFRGRGIGSRVRGCHLRKYMHLHTKYMQIQHIHTYICICIHIHALTWAGFVYMHIHTYTCIYMHIHAYTFIYIIYIHIHTSATICQEVFLRGCSLRSRASGRIPTNQT